MAIKSQKKEQLERGASELEHEAHSLSSKESRNDKIEALSRAFKLFSQETVKLETAHSQLKEKFYDVNLELERTNSRLSQKVEELDITTSYLRSILGNMSQGLLYVNRSGIVTTYNKSAEKIFERSAVEVLFHPFENSFSDDLFGFSLREALNTKSVPAAISLTRFEGTAQAQHLEVDACYINSTLPHPEHLDASLNFQEGLIFLVRDRTKHHRLKTRADRNDRMKDLGEMAAMVAHEIRNPLGGIKGFGSLLERDLEDNPKLQEMARFIVLGCDKLNRLVTEMLNYTRPVDPHIKEVDLCKVLEDVLYHVRMDENLPEGIKFSFEQQVPQLHAHVDSELLESALLNLVLNATQAMPDGGTVSLWLDHVGGDAIIRVSDTGEGIPAKDLENIYLPFFTTKAKGNGFGLTEVHKVIQVHHGEIETTSQLGKGTTFTIKLPLKARASNQRT